MRLLHTSDWHLGQTLHDFDRSHEHQCFLDWLLQTIAAEAADVLLIVGDVFDNANPPASAQRQLYRFLQQARLANPGLQIVIVAGNHDSAARLEAPAPLFEEMGIHVVGQVQRLHNDEMNGEMNGAINLAKLLVPLYTRDGKQAAWCMAVPFLRPGDVPRVAAETLAAGGDAYLAGVAELYRQVLTLALAQRQSGQALLATGHCHMVGGEVSQESERNIVIGGSEALPAGIFDARFAYCALGHLHLAQKVGKQEHIRYCGSPLPLSFAETHYRHQILCVDLDGEQLKSVREILVPRAVPLLRIPARPAPLDEVLAALAALDLPPDTPQALQPNLQPYLQVRVLLQAPEPGLRARIEAALEGKAVRLARIETASATPQDNPDEISALSLDDLQKLRPEDIFTRLYRQSHGVDEVPAPLLAGFHELLQDANRPA